VVALLAYWGFPIRASVVAVLIAVQGALMVRFLRRPRELAPWYNGTGTTLYVAGMMVTAFALSAVVTG
jgi:chlorophyll synthase